MVSQFDLYDLIKGKGWLSSKEISKIVYGDDSDTNLKNTRPKLAQLIKYKFVEKKKLETNWEKKVYGHTYSYKAIENE